MARYNTVLETNSLNIKEFQGIQLVLSKNGWLNAIRSCNSAQNAKNMVFAIHLAIFCTVEQPSWILKIVTPE